MKQSEAVKFLEGFLIALDARIEPLHYNKKAFSIIKFLEGNGIMTPPSRSPTPEELGVTPDDDNYETASVFMKLNKWEDE